MQVNNHIYFMSCIFIVLTLLTGCSLPAQTPGVTAVFSPIPPSHTPQPSSTPTRVPTQPPTATVTSSPTVTSTATPQPLVHRIAIRIVDGVGEFYDRNTGVKFVPRGNNYIHVATQLAYGGNAFTNTSTFNTDLYNPKEADAVLSRMQSEGYNAVRVFIQGNCEDYCIGDPVEGLRDAYIANMVDFLQKAKSHGIFVILTGDDEPISPYYDQLLHTNLSEDFGYANRDFLTSGGILVAKAYWGDLVDALASQNAPIDYILAYELRNELFYELNSPPLSYRTGKIETANGKTYDMASAEDRLHMMDENLLLWIDQTRTAILEHDPTALVTIGFFVPQRPNSARQGDPRWIETRPVIWESSLDFIDLHPYPRYNFGLASYVENFGMTGMQAKPIIMGELGAARSIFYTEITAARVLQNWQVESCRYGFDGWLLWTYNKIDEGFYYGLSGDGEIDTVLAPANRPDPCQPGDFDFFK